jgi:hypothetical protein
MSLYAIQNELMILLDACADSAGNLDPATEAALAEHTLALTEAFDSKADAYAALIRTAEVRAEARRAEAKRMVALAESDEALASRLSRVLMDAMVATGKQKVDTERFRLSVRANGGKAPLVIHDEAALPPDYRVPVYSERLDRDAIRTALEQGTAVPGAALGQRGVRLDIR